MSKNEIKSIMEKYGEYALKTKEYQRFKADKTYEYLYILIKFNT